MRAVGLLAVKAAADNVVGMIYYFAVCQPANWLAWWQGVDAGCFA